MKKRMFVLLVFVFALFSSGGVSALGCSLDATLINQDPYPAIPGEEVKVVFQLTGVSNPACDDVSFRLVEAYPFSLEPDFDAVQSINGGTYLRDYVSHWMIPYNLRIDEHAVDGENEIEVIYMQGGSFSVRESFNITIEDVATDFEISVKDFDSSTNILEFEILNFGEHEAEAVTVEIPNQENIVVKGSNRNIVGDLDSNEDSTFSFEALPVDGIINLVVKYSDEIAVRRELTKQVEYNSAYFTDRKADEVQPRPTSFYVAVFLVLVIIFMIFRERRRKKKEKLRKMKERSHHHRGK